MMRIDELGLEWHALPAPLPMRRATVDADAWLGVARAVAEDGGRLVALWGTDATGAVPALRVSAAYATADGLLWIDLPLAAPGFEYPDLVPLFPAAGRMQRAAHDLAGTVARDASDRRPWLQHGAWPAEWFPLRAGNAAGAPPPPSPVTDYPFIQVAGDGVHEIPVGPVHAGIIEPGHFRFSVVGEKVLRLEERLGYTHKGIEQRFTTLPPLDAHRLAGRVSGDSTVAGAWAYCMALESAAGCEIPARAAWLRALLLERERVANHLGDLGALGNDVALAFGLAQFSRLKEDWLRLSNEAFGHRFMMDRVVPGGVATDVGLGVLERIARQCAAVESDVRALRAIYDEHAGLQDRFMQTGIVTPALAAQLGLTGLAGRASGQARDLRVDHPWLPYAALACAKAGHTDGDVAARAQVRFDETLESLRLIRAICAELPAGATRAALALPDGRVAGAGWIEGWRGEVFVALELDGAAGASRIVRCHVHDPSWQNWPVLEHAIIGNIVPDFPLINKSFNLSYSGQDL
jgi:Ni,Fe-hydrogenase III large subunit/Ni,Fe-hydrogenase III component G